MEHIISNEQEPPSICQTPLTQLLNVSTECLLKVLKRLDKQVEQRTLKKASVHTEILPRNTASKLSKYKIGLEDCIELGIKKRKGGYAIIRSTQRAQGFGTTKN